MNSNISEMMMNSGALEGLTGGHVVTASQLVRTGRVYSLAVEANADAPSYDGRSYQVLTDRIYAESEYTFGRDKVQFFDDYVSMWCGVGTHLDGFGHAAIDGKHFGGLDTADVMRPRGAAQLGIETVPPIVARGVCLDIAGLHGRDALDPTHEISPDDIDRAAASQGVSIKQGDVVLLHTGTIRDVANTAPFSHASAGLGVEGARHLVENLGVVAIGADNWAVEITPPTDPELVLPVHAYLLVERGVHMIEFVWTHDLAADGIGEFLFVLAAPKLQGALQAPVHPVAIV